MVQWNLSGPNSIGGANHSERHGGTVNLEDGNVNKELERDALPEKVENSDEYTNLLRYIQTYRDGRRKSTASGITGTGDNPEDAADASQTKKRPWWAFWRKNGGGSGEDFETPDEWIGTDLSTGLTSAEVENRRKKTGWNELTTEKENLFIKFLSFFTGPILYGTCC
jgi:H+-transporting ATPase